MQSNLRNVSMMRCAFNEAISEPPYLSSWDHDKMYPTQILGRLPMHHGMASLGETIMGQPYDQCKGGLILLFIFEKKQV